MDKSVADSRIWLRGEISKPISIIYIFILINTVKLAVSQSSATECNLDLQFSSALSSRGCEWGDWGGFLHNSSCGVAFHTYLYALGKWANQTGQIFINSTEQKNCLNSMKSFEDNAFGCGIEKLTRGGGGCLDFSVELVTRKLGGELRRLNENCELVKSNEECDQSCESCANTWESISRTRSISAIVGVDIDEIVICQFAVLVSLISRIGDPMNAHTLLRCLGAQKMNDGNTSAAGDNQAPKGTSWKIQISTGVGILAGSIVGIALIVVVIARKILSKGCSKSSPPRKKDAFKNIFPKESACRKVPIKEVYSATDNLSDENFIGEGTAGKVYKGILSNNQHVAIKHIINDGDVESFVREVTSLSHVRHPNLVALLGCSVRENECFLVYEFCPLGNLSEWLFGKDTVLTWIRRLEIAIDSARGLWFLHTYAEGCIVHRDIKPTNILLGTNFEAKLSDFGLSKIIDMGKTHVSSEVRGTFGYVDPEYRINRRVNSSADVYSFGMVLLQILSGKRVINLNLKKPMSLAKMATILTRGGSVVEFADPKLKGAYSIEAFELTLHLALSCTSLGEQRPSMKRVLERLEEALEISTRATACIRVGTTPDELELHTRETLDIIS